MRLTRQCKSEYALMEYIRYGFFGAQCGISFQQVLTARHSAGQFDQRHRQDVGFDSEAEKRRMRVVGDAACRRRQTTKNQSRRMSARRLTKERHEKYSSYFPDPATWRN